MEGSASATQASTQTSTQLSIEAPTGVARPSKNRGRRSKRLGYEKWNGVGLMQNGLKPTFRPPQQVILLQF